MIEKANLSLFRECIQINKDINLDLDFSVKKFNISSSKKHLKILRNVTW